MGRMTKAHPFLARNLSLEATPDAATPVIPELFSCQSYFVIPLESLCERRAADCIESNIVRTRRTRVSIRNTLAKCEPPSQLERLFPKQRFTSHGDCRGQR